MQEQRCRRSRSNRADASVQVIDHAHNWTYASDSLRTSRLHSSDPALVAEKLRQRTGMEELNDPVLVPVPTKVVSDVDLHKKAHDKGRPSLTPFMLVA